MAVFRARYAGKCNKCAGSIAQGEFISWSKKTKGIVYHARCINPNDVPGEAQPQPASQPQPSSQGESSQPQPQPSPAQGGGVTEARVKEIASALDGELANDILKSVRKAVDRAIAAERPAKLTVIIKDAASETSHSIEVAHYMLDRLVYLINKREHAYLHGPVGSGKSTGAFQGSQVLGMRYGYVSLNKQTPESRLLGYMDAGGRYQETVFYQLYTGGGVMCIDELDNGSAGLLNTINGMLEKDADGVGRGAFPCGVVERHPDFVCIATGNTNGRGGDKLFPERSALDAAFLERFSFLGWGYDLAMEKSVALNINPKNGPAWLAFVRAVRTYCADNGIRLWASPRASFKGCNMLRDSGWSPEDIADAVLFKGIDPDTRARVLSACPLPTVEA